LKRYHGAVAGRQSRVTAPRPPGGRRFTVNVTAPPTSDPGGAVTGGRPDPAAMTPFDAECRGPGTPAAQAQRAGTSYWKATSPLGWPGVASAGRQVRTYSTRTFVAATVTRSLPELGSTSPVYDDALSSA
jgi:hypothetical protein